MNEKDYDEIAGEYVLGTLSQAERLEVKNLIERDENFARLVSQWEEHLAPLSEHVREEKPPAKVWQNIFNKLEERVGRDEKNPGDLLLDDAIIMLKRSRNRWRGIAVGAMALAASFIGLQASGVLTPFLQPQAPEGRFVAVLNPSGSNAGFVIRVDIASKRLDIERLIDKAPSGKDYELWLIEPQKKPKSLNVVGRNAIQKVNYRAEGQDSSLSFAITLEPEGGSPTGVATGPIVYSGKLLTLK